MRRDTSPRFARVGASRVNEGDSAADLLQDGYVLILRNMTREREYIDSVAWQATHDDLTGLVNRAEFEHRLALSLDRACTSAMKASAALLFLDLDRFKVVNDTCGHAAGNAMLREVSGRFANCITRDDTLARLGGDEFAVLLHASSTADIEVGDTQLLDTQPQRAELLLRMRDSEGGGVITPNFFIPAAERYGLMTAIDRWVVRTSFDTLARSPDKRYREYAINLSGASVGDERFLGYLREQFTRTGVAPDLICFEVTETTAIANLTSAARFMRELSSLGCHFALDDFGAGMSSFGYLKHLPVEYLKIDGSFVKDIEHDTVSRDMVAAINEMGHSMKCKTIAEYVESEGILRILGELGVDYAQGYYIGRPALWTEQATHSQAKEV